MNPIKVNTRKEKCVHVSSNCVIWQGGDLPCINICKGDSISEIQFKAATVICNLQKELDLSDLDISSIVTACSTCAQPVKKLKTVLHLIIEKIKNNTGTTTTSAIVDNVVVATCLRTNDLNGIPVTSVTHKDYTRKIGLKMCEMLITLNNQQNTLNQHTNAINALQSADHSQEDINVSLSYLGGGSITNPVVQKVDDAVELIEKSYGQLKTILGETTDLSGVLAVESKPTGSPSGIYSLSEPGRALWVTGATTIGGTLKHMWTAINDMRGAVKGVLDNCCKIGCDSIIVDFDIKLGSSNEPGDRSLVKLFFISRSRVPLGYSDYNAIGNRLTITDSNGNQAFFNVKIADEVNNPDGFSIDLSSTAIDTMLDYNFSIDASLTNGSTTCVKCVNKTVTYKNTCAFCEIKASGFQGTANGKAIIVYEVLGVRTAKTMLAGETIIISKAAKVISIASENITLSSDCLTLPVASALVCYKINWSTDEAGGGSHPWSDDGSGGDSGETNAVGFGYLDQQFLINASAYIPGGVAVAINAKVPQGTFTYTNTATSGTNIKNHSFYFKTIPAIGETAYIKFITNGFSPVKVLAETCVDCCEAVIVQN